MKIDVTVDDYTQIIGRQTLEIECLRKIISILENKLAQYEETKNAESKKPKG